MTTAPTPTAGEASEATEDLHVVDDLGNGFGDHKVLGSIDVAVRAREFMCIVGPSGAGKTTLLQCLSGLTAPTRVPLPFARTCDGASGGDGERLPGTLAR